MEGTQGVLGVTVREALERRVPHPAHPDHPVFRVEPAWGLAIAAGEADRPACQSQAHMLS